jgi:DNA-binding beta-propeller fold protein YncE
LANGTGYDYATVAYDAQSGASVWTRRYDGPGHSHDTANAIAVSPDGTKVFVTGESWGSTSSDYATVAYDAQSGGSLWTKRYDGPLHSEDAAFVMTVSPDGSKVFVAGVVDILQGASEDYLTIAYSIP